MNSLLKTVGWGTHVVTILLVYLKLQLIFQCLDRRFQYVFKAFLTFGLFFHICLILLVKVGSLFFKFDNTVSQLMFIGLAYE